jgi:hypothetical protein
MKWFIIPILLFSASAGSALNISCELDPELHPGDNTNIIVTLDNFRGRKIYGIKVDAEIEPFTGYINVTPQHIYELDGGEIVKMNLPISVSVDAGWGRYALRVFARYIENFEEKVEESYAEINITKPPLLDIIEVTPGEDVKPGESFVIKVKLKNVGSGSAKNIRVFIAYEITEQEEIQPGAPFSPSQLTQANLQLVDIPFTPLRDFIGYVGILEPKEEAEVDFPLVADEDAEKTAYSIPVLIFYQNEKGVEQEPIDDVIGILLKGKPELVVAGVSQDPSRVLPGQEFTLSIQVENLGSAPAKSVKAEIGNLAEYLGTIEPDSIATAIFELVAGKQGIQNYSIEITYQDPDGNRLSLTEKIPVWVKGEDWKIFQVAAIIFLAAILIFIWRRRK